MSPSMIVKVKPNPDFNQERIMFGLYAQVYIGTSNGTNRKSIPSIALNKSKYHGLHYFMRLYNRKILHSYECTEVPIDNDTIEQSNPVVFRRKRTTR